MIQNAFYSWIRYIMGWISSARATMSLVLPATQVGLNPERSRTMGEASLPFSLKHLIMLLTSLSLFPYPIASFLAFSIERSEVESVFSSFHHITSGNWISFPVRKAWIRLSRFMFSSWETRRSSDISSSRSGACHFGLPRVLGVSFIVCLYLRLSGHTVECRRPVSLSSSPC